MRRSPKQGFTLLECLIVLAIIAILAVISYPLYTQHLRQTHRLQAAITLSTLQAQLAEHYLIEQSYQNANLAELGVNTQHLDGFYQLALTVLDADHYILRADPKGPQAQDPCGGLTLTHTGQKGTTGSLPSEQCW